MPGKRKHAVQHKDDSEDLLGRSNLNHKLVPNGKRLRRSRVDSTASARMGTIVDSSETTPEAQDSALRESSVEAEASNGISRQTRRGKVRVEIAISPPAKRAKKTSCPKNRDSQSSHTSHEAAGNQPSLLVPSHVDPSPTSQTASAEQAQWNLAATKLGVLKRLKHLNIATSDSESSVNCKAARQLGDLIDGTVKRGEGNSCLLLGPRGSGKTTMVETCLVHLSDNPVVLRLSGWVQTSDRLALREIALQLLQQTGSSLLSDLNLPPLEGGQDENEENPFLDAQDSRAIVDDLHFSLPPSSQLHSLIPALLTLKRPVIVILDAFDLFALHPRQSLLYCLLDTVQNCRASVDNGGIAVVGITSRVDTIQLLEKRVKSRFSGRTIRTASSGSFESYLTSVQDNLTPNTLALDGRISEEWGQQWASCIQNLLAEKEVLELLQETFGLSRDPKLMSRILMACIVQLRPSAPHLIHKHLATAIEAQRSRSLHFGATNLSYPATCLLIASVHVETSGHSTFTFEMLSESIREQIRSSSSAPVQVKGGSIGMVRCSREVLMAAFESLTAAKIFVPLMASSTTTPKEFLKHRCSLGKDIVKSIVEKAGQVNLRKWLSKAS